MLAIILTGICLIFTAVFIYSKKQFQYWKNLGVQGPEPTFVLGNMRDVYQLKDPEPLIMHNWYQEFKSEPYIGYYNLWKPTLLVMDPHLIKEFNEVNFNHFTDHPPVCGKSLHDAIMDSLLTMKGSLWKVKRQIFSKLFTPKKLREFCEIMNHYDSALLEEIDAYCEEVPLEDIAKRHMIRTVSHIMYNLDVSKNEEIFLKLSQLSEVFARPPLTTVLKYSLFTVAPRLFEFLGLSTFPRELWDFFSNLTNQLVHSRNQAKFGREDLVSLVAQLQKEGSLGTESE